MSQDIVNILTDVGRFSESIGDAYAAKYFSRSDVGATDVHWQGLVKRKIFMSAPDGRWALNADLRKFIGTANHRQLLSTRFPSLAAATKDLEMLSAYYIQLYSSGAVEDLADAAKEFYEGCEDIRQSLDGVILELKTLLDTNLGNVRTFNQKQLQNKHYLSSLTSLIDALTVLMTHELRDLVRDHPDLYSSFNTGITKNLQNWTGESFSISSRLAYLMSKFRVLNMSLRRVQMLNLFIKKNKRDSMVKVTMRMIRDNPPTALFFARAEPVKLGGVVLPLTLTSLDRQTIEKASAGLKINPQSESKKRIDRLLNPKISIPASPDETSAILGGEIKAKAQLRVSLGLGPKSNYREARVALCKAAMASPTPLSLCAWLSGNSGYGIEKNVFAHMILVDRHKGAGLVFDGPGAPCLRVVYADRSRLQGNLFVKDILLGRKLVIGD